MKIVTNTANEKRFGDLRHGDLFKFDGFYWMVVSPMSVYGRNFDTVNAVELHDGNLHHFVNNILVMPCDAELIIK